MLSISLVFAAALLLRAYHFSTMPIDRMDESYHRWLMTTLTIENRGVYSDFKPMPNMAILWLPLFQYLSGFLMLISHNGSILIPRLVSMFFGALTSIVVYFICLRLYENRWLATVGGLVLGFQPWHIDYSTVGVPGALLSFLVALAVFSFITNKVWLFSLSSALAMLTSYEAWFVTAFLLVIGFRYCGSKTRRTLLPIGVALAVALGWCGWSAIQAKHPLEWFATYLASIGWVPHLGDPSETLLFYTNEAIKMTFFLFVIGVVLGMLRSRETRVLTCLSIAYIVFYTFAHLVGLDYGDPGRLVVILPLMSAVLPPALPKPNKRVLLGLALLVLLAVPYFSLIWIFPKNVYVVTPESRAGLALGKAYVRGSVLCDFPSVMYFSRLKPNRFISYEHLDWYLNLRDDAKLEEWLKHSDVTLLVWQNVTYSKCWKIFSSLGEGRNQTIGRVNFTLVYEDSSRTGYWEHRYNATDIFLYKIDQFNQRPS